MTENINKTLYINIKGLYQIRENQSKGLRNEAMNTCPHIEDGFLLCEADRILDYGSMKDLDATLLSESDVHDLTGRYLFPTFVDSHTHLVFAASREGEFEDRIRGLSYEEIANKGGGILNSAKHLEHCSEDQLFDDALKRLNTLIKFGTGAIEIKSGYGLSLDAELKILRVIRRLKEENLIPIKATFLGAHAIPKAYKQNRRAYIDLIINEMLPQIKSEQLADYIDVFCEKNYFTVEETEELMIAGKAHGLKPKLHVNQFNALGAVEAGVRHGAISLDHLEEMTEMDFNHLAKSETIATALPSCSFFLNIPYAPAKEMINKGITLALASDYNPGSTPSGNLSFVFSLACIKQKLTPEQALNALTFNAACAIEMQDELGSISKGKRANFIITKPMPSLAYLPYSFGENQIETVVINGKHIN
ncbi:MAG: imidazolonepropionase [Flavobacteriales bacterium]